jgi:hypothetical protein
MWLSRFRRGPLPARRTDVRATVRYVAAEWRSPPFDLDGPPRTGLPFQEREVEICDLRHAAEPASLAVNGFALLDHESRVSDFSDGHQIENIYLREVEELVRRASGADHVFAYPRAVQRSNRHPARRDGVIADVIAPLAHIDATERSIDLLAAAALARAGRSKAPGARVAYYTVWRSLSPPPQDQALALCDLRTVKPIDLVPADAVENPGSVDARIEYYLLKANSKHRWFYYSDMSPTEVLLFRQFDSGVAGPSGCPHSSFAHPDHASAPPRLSIEARACAFFE